MTTPQPQNPLSQLPGGVKALLMLPMKLIPIAILLAASPVLWPLYWIATLLSYHPPNVVRIAQAMRYLRLVWTAKPQSPGLPSYKRLWMTLSIIQKVLMTPVLGLTWLIDELLYGRKLNAIQVSNPLFIVSGGRSGSTQMGLYLEQDPQFTAPNLLQSMFPYLWLWHLAPRIAGRFITQDQVREKLQSMMPPELLERHEGDPFKMDTFDGAFFNAHLNPMALHLGPAIAIEEFGFHKFAPHDQRMWEQDFTILVDRVARKTLLLAGPKSDGSPRRFLLKGHFLAGAELLAQKYPDACFLTIIREPAARLRSGINYLRVNPSDPVLGPVPWEWLSTSLECTEAEYCEVEQAWFTQSDGVHRCVIRFSDFIADLQGSMHKVYRECCDTDEFPPYIPADHPPRERKQYSINRTLDELGIDVDKLNTRLAGYIAWCRGENKNSVKTE